MDNKSTKDKELLVMLLCNTIIHAVRLFNKIKDTIKVEMSLGSCSHAWQKFAQVLNVDNCSYLRARPITMCFSTHIYETYTYGTSKQNITRFGWIFVYQKKKTLKFQLIEFNLLCKLEVRVCVKTSVCRQYKNYWTFQSKA